MAVDNIFRFLRYRSHSSRPRTWEDFILIAIATAVYIGIYYFLKSRCPDMNDGRRKGISAFSSFLVFIVYLFLIKPAL